MTENAVNLAIQYVLPKKPARPRFSFLFHEKLIPSVSLLVSGSKLEAMANWLGFAYKSFYFRWSPKFATRLNVIIGIHQKIYG